MKNNSSERRDEALKRLLTKLKKQNKDSKESKKPKGSPFYKGLKSVAPDVLGTISNMYLPGTGPIVSTVSKTAMDWFGRITGFGDYNIQSNSVISDQGRSLGEPKPVFGHGGIRKKFREFVRDVTVHTDGTFKQLFRTVVNPSNINLFPGLSIEAQKYQQYFIHGCVIELESTCSKSVTLTDGKMAIPTVILSATYDNQLDDPENPQQVMNTYFTTSRPVNEDMYHPLECDPSQRQTGILTLWNGSGNEQSQDNLKNLCTLRAWSVGGSQTVGFVAYRMYINYDVEFLKPWLPKKIPRFSDDYTLSIPLTGDTFGALRKLDKYSTTYGWSERPYSITGNVITFGDTMYGSVMICYTSGATVATIPDAQAPVLGGGAVLENIYDENTVALVTNMDGVTAAKYSFLNLSVKISGGGTITFDEISDTNWDYGELVISGFS